MLRGAICSQLISNEHTYGHTDDRTYKACIFYWARLSHKRYNYNSTLSQVSMSFLGVRVGLHTHGQTDGRTKYSAEVAYKLATLSLPWAMRAWASWAGSWTRRAGSGRSGSRSGPGSASRSRPGCPCSLNKSWSTTAKRIGTIIVSWIVLSYYSVSLYFHLTLIEPSAREVKAKFFGTSCMLKTLPLEI